MLVFTNHLAVQAVTEKDKDYLHCLTFNTLTFKSL
jgi:hypothetical protein